MMLSEGVSLLWILVNGVPWVRTLGQRLSRPDKTRENERLIFKIWGGSGVREFRPKKKVHGVSVKGFELSVLVTIIVPS